MPTTRIVVSYVLRVLNVVVLNLVFATKLASSVTFLCHFLSVIEAALICAMLLTVIGVIVLDFFAALFHRCLSLKNLKPKNTLSYLIFCRFSLMMSINLVLYQLY